MVKERFATARDSFAQRILRLALLAPDIVDAIAGTADQAIMLEQLERPLPASWEEQRTQNGRPTVGQRFV